MHFRHMRDLSEMGSAGPERRSIGEAALKEIGLTTLPLD
jgi:hypothetical protein